MSIQARKGKAVSTEPNERDRAQQPGPGNAMGESAVGDSNPDLSEEPLLENVREEISDRDSHEQISAPIDAAGEPDERPGAPDQQPHEPASAVADKQDDESEGDAEENGEDVEDVEPLELIQEASADEELSTDWYILKVQVNREDSIRDALARRVKIEGLERFFKEIIVPTEDVAEFTKTGKRRVVKRKLYPGYIMVNMHINDETWFLVRETPGIGDFTGSAGKPTPMQTRDVERILHLGKAADEGDTHVKTAIPFRQGDRVRVKDGYFQNFEGDVESVDEANGRVTVMINIFGRSTPVELEHWQIETV